MRLRTATGLALASLCALSAVMFLGGPHTGGGTATNTLDTTILVIDDAPAPSDVLPSWDCPQNAATSALS